MSDWPPGTGRLALATVDSTNAEALRGLSAGAPAAPFWVQADSQSAGRARRGRAWQGLSGNFFASYALDLAATPPGEAALRSFTAALALDEALQAAGVPAHRLALKWPNDVLLDERKLAGILLESTLREGRMGLVVGIGVNLAAAPDPATLEPGAVHPVALAGVGIRITPAAFLELLAPPMARWEACLQAEGFAPVRAAWLARAARLGQVITAKLPTETFEGRFETVDATGAVVLKTATGRRALPAGEIFF
ncbi:biotin--[acetyl-CoA-carboxylase] ligase [Oceanibium sediminis]|uniref:biotin--[acetyl-CoA-carboxylase] ligase n=1 Tax=Oceanibium sediminis TaxID=2026339 RepID=UPI000DD4C7E8|nr:biotin--[acetyl-CoA-carboxylase] ligase [Oceanibium sediminis]